MSCSKLCQRSAMFLQLSIWSVRIKVDANITLLRQLSPGEVLSIKEGGTASGSLDSSEYAPHRAVIGIADSRKVTGL